MRKNFFEILKIEYQNIFHLKEVKTFLRVSHDKDDKLIENLIFVAIDLAENFTGLCLNKKYIKYVSYDNSTIEIRLKHLPINSINKVFYKNNNQEKDIEIFDFKARKDLGILYLKSSLIFGCELNIIYESFLDKTLIPFALKQGILEHIGHIYDIGETNDFLPGRIKNFYFPYRIIRV